MRLAGVAACLPKNVVDTSIAKEHFDEFDVKRIIGNTGVEQKREAEPGIAVSDLCRGAAEPLIEKLGWDRESIDAVILVTTLADHIMPATSHLIQRDLGLSANCLVFDINLACSGFTHGMLVMNALMAGGLIKRGILLCGEMTSGTFRPRLADVRHREDLANAILFGDAGTATALEASGDQVKAVRYGADGSGAHHLIVPGGLGRDFFRAELLERREEKQGDDVVHRRPLDLVMHGPEILTFTMKRVPPLVKGLLEDASWERDEVDVWVPHQANRFMLNFLTRRLKLNADKVLLSIERFGNTASASIPLTMVTTGGDYLTKPTKWGMLGFGVGLSWSGLLIETDEVLALPLIEI